MVKERTEEEKVTRAPIVVILGGREYEIKPLVIRDSREWRRKVIDLIAPLPRLVNITMDTPEDFTKALTELLVTMPDATIDLVFGYARDLNREEIEGEATEDEVAGVLNKIFEVAFPLTRSLPAIVGRLSQ